MGLCKRDVTRMTKNVVTKCVDSRLISLFVIDNILSIVLYKLPIAISVIFGYCLVFPKR